ncbi:MAG: hypothetical protein UW11_C0019G0022 [Parcubacteria group bacterium GW2011_GWA2_43_9b]|nr:MAG: hypothetical protein UW11_C0019G0022 [Parcubacteria group bacterium GW2011_GWA2_43_9b]
MYLIQIALLSVALLNLGLGLFIFYRNRIKIINVSYFLFCFSTAVWSFGMLMYYRSGVDFDGVLIWSKILYFAGSLVALFFLWFVINYIDKKIEKIFPHFVLLMLPSAVIFYLLYADLIIKDINFFPGNTQLILGEYWWIYYLQFFAYFTWAFILLLKHYFASYGIEKTRTFYFFSGSLVPCAGASIVNMILPYFGNFKYAWLGPVFLLFLILNIFYAIVRYQFFDIKLALRRSIVYILSVLAVAAPASGVLYLVNQFIPQYLTYASIAALVAAVSVFSPIRDYYYRVANKYFFSSLYDANQVIARVSDGLRSTLDAGEIYNLISGVLMNSLHTKAVGILNYEAVQFNNGFALNGRKTFPGDSGLQEEYGKQSKVMIVEEIKNTAYDQHKEIIDLLTSLNAAAVVPLNVKDEALGIIVLGQKESGDMYNDEDLRTLETIASQSAMAIKNAQLYGETKQFSQTLQAEVERQTAELKFANEELQRLDQAKSDFISIASHQLRTPLTAIKGFASMVLEGDYGKVTKAVGDKIEKIFASSERLIRLVNDLLDLSHMEGGKMEFNFARVDFDAMVKSVVEELKPNAMKKKLKFGWQTPDSEFWVWADEQKLRQVAMNLIDNAIKYTQQGSVEVYLEHKDGQAVMAVKDTGMGMHLGESEHLFEKFVRGSEASRYHTEGAGVGLYVAKKIIEEHKGEVWAESPGDGLGSTFFVRLPEWKG